MAKKRRRIKGVTPNQSDLIRANDPPDYDEHPPIFSLHRLQSGDYCFSCMSQEDKASFGDAIFRRRSLTWREIKQVPRQGLGFEKIPKYQIRASMPPFITDDVDHFLVFRFGGDKRMVGYRQHDKFYVLWFDHNLTLYDHGS